MRDDEVANLLAVGSGDAPLLVDGNLPPEGNSNMDTRRRPVANTPARKDLCRKG